jgi:hypothetical protein
LNSEFRLDDVQDVRGLLVLVDAHRLLSTEEEAGVGERRASPRPIVEADEPSATGVRDLAEQRGLADAAGTLQEEDGVSSIRLSASGRQRRAITSIDCRAIP